MAAVASLTIIVFLVPLAIMLGVGMYLIVASRRGRGFGYPACGACNYDLSGSVGAVPRCPECGADFKIVGITPPGGRRSKPMLISGIVLLILPVTCAGGAMVSFLMASARAQQTIVIAPVPAPLPARQPSPPGVMPQPVDAKPITPQLADEAEIESAE